MNWETLVVDEDYDICRDYPYQIKRKSNGRIIKESVDKDGYVGCHLNQKHYYKHVLVAKQFIPNDDPLHKTDVDHISRDRSDFHISNLRWCTRAENLRNMSSSHGIQFEYFDEIPLEDPDDAVIEVTEYGNHEFDNVYFYNNYFYIYNGLQYRRATIQYNNAGNAYIQTYDTNHKKTAINYIKFKKLYELV